jgi:hypothetical protein
MEILLVCFLTVRPVVPFWGTKHTIGETFGDFCFFLMKTALFFNGSA